MKAVCVKFPDSYIDGLDELVKSGRYLNRSDAVRTAVRYLLERELWGGKTEHKRSSNRSSVIDAGVGGKNVGRGKRTG